MPPPSPLRAVAPPPGRDELFWRYSAYVARLAMRLVGRDEEVDDVVQDVFLAVYGKMPVFTEEHEIRGWLATVTVRICGRRLRRRRLARFLGLDEAPDELTLAPGASPEASAVLGQLYRRLDTLPTDVRLAWTLRHVEDQPLQDVARQCGCSLATAKRRIAAAQAALSQGAWP